MKAPPEAAEPETGDEDPVELEQVVRAWPAVLDQLRRSSAPALAALFEGAKPVEIDRDAATLTVGFPASSTFNKRKAEVPDKREQMAAALESVTGARLRPVYAVLKAEPAVAESSGRAEDVDEDELVERLKSEFDAEEVG